MSVGDGMKARRWGLWGVSALALLLAGCARPQPGEDDGNRQAGTGMEAAGKVHMALPSASKERDGASAAGDGAAAGPLLAEQRALDIARAQSAAALARSRTLEGQAKAATDNADKARIAAAAMAARIQSAEADISAAQAKLALVQRAQALQANRLADEQQPVVQLTGMLQMLARKPAISVLAQPGTVDDLVHARAILGATIPEIEKRTAGLRAEMARSRTLKREAELALQTLSSARERLAAERTALTKLEQAQRIQSRNLAASADVESTRAVAMGEKARDIVELMESLRADGEVREELAELDGPMLRPAQPEASGMPSLASMRNAVFGGGDAAARQQAIAYRLPVMGEVVAGLGEVSPSGVRSRGLTISAQSGAQIVAPAAGRVAFAAPYRGFGTILIIEHPGGWTSLITNMISTSVRVGDDVVAGAPIGRAGPDRPEVTIELRKSGVPQDIVALVG